MAIIQEDDPRITLGHDRLDRYWSAIGPSDPDRISYIINPMYSGKPAWPSSRQAYRVVRPPCSLIIATDGLSDPFVGTDIEDAQGFGCEVYIEAPELADADFDAISSSWAFAVIETFAMNVANWGGISSQIELHDVLSTEIQMRDVLPEGCLASDGAAGFLVNLTPPGRHPQILDMPFGPVDIVALTLVSPAELEMMRAGGVPARDQLARARQLDGGHMSRLSPAAE
ncbi:MAG: suppressor of fused domain protein [Alphaproteobacteria bacterium]|nr:suppressor of fused domain protein [Alphaproteobacteria bacterium]